MNLTGRGRLAFEMENDRQYKQDAEYRQTDRLEGNTRSGDCSLIVEDRNGSTCKSQENSNDHKDIPPYFGRSLRNGVAQQLLIIHQEKEGDISYWKKHHPKSTGRYCEVKLGLA